MKKEAGPSDIPPDELRCFRSDGKRWRCKNPRISGSIYCEVHYQRCRQRSDAMKLRKRKNDLDKERRETEERKRKIGIPREDTDNQGIKRKSLVGHDARMCHQCWRNDRGRVVWCLMCGRERYCLPCIRNRYPHLSEATIAKACPLCCKTCNCMKCLRMKGIREHKERSQLRFQQMRQAGQPAFKEPTPHLPNGVLSPPTSTNLSSDNLGSEEVASSEDDTHGDLQTQEDRNCCADVISSEDGMDADLQTQEDICERDTLGELRDSMFPLKLGETANMMASSVNSSVQRFQQEINDSTCHAETTPVDHLEGIIVLFLVSDCGVVYVVQDVTPLAVDFCLSHHLEPQAMLFLQSFEQSMEFSVDAVMGQTSFMDQTPRLSIGMTTSLHMPVDPLHSLGSELDDFIAEAAKSLIMSFRKKLMEAEILPPVDLLLSMVNAVTSALVGMGIPTSSWTDYSDTLVKHAREIEELEATQREGHVQAQIKNLEDAHSTVAALKEIHQRATTAVDVADVTRKKSQFMMKMAKSEVIRLEKELLAARDRFSEAKMDAEEMDDAFRMAFSIVEESNELVKDGVKSIANAEAALARFLEEKNLLKKHMKEFHDMVERLDDVLF